MQSHYDRSSQNPSGLVKQAYSAFVLLSPNTKPRKWHLTAYFTYTDLPNIPTVDKDAILRKIAVPPGMYRSGKARSRNDDDEGMSDYDRNCSSSPPPHGHGVRYSLPPLHSAVAPHSGYAGPSRMHTARMSEDERVIHLLNSHHIR